MVVDLWLVCSSPDRDRAGRGPSEPVSRELNSRGLDQALSNVAVGRVGAIHTVAIHRLTLPHGNPHTGLSHTIEYDYSARSEIMTIEQMSREYQPLRAYAAMERDGHLMACDATI